MSDSANVNVGEILLSEGILTSEEIKDLARDAAIASSPLASLLKSTVHISRAELAAFLGADYTVPVVRDPKKLRIPEKVLQTLTPEEVVRHGVLPLARVGDVLLLAVSRPENMQALSEVRLRTGLRLKVFRAEARELQEALSQFYGVADKGADSVPLISMNEDSSDLEAVQITAHELDDARSFAAPRLFTTFEQLHLMNEAEEPIRLS